MAQTFTNYIGGRWAPAKSGQTFKNLNPATGCLKPILVTLDRDPHDRVFGDKEVSRKQDKDEVTILRAGLAHLIGVGIEEALDL